MPKNSVPSLDRSAITLPSDQITFGQMRARQPEVFSNYLHSNVLDLEPIGMADRELILAEKAFAATLKLPDPHPQEDARDLAEGLDAVYQEWGLSNGPQQSKELIRRFQQAAVSQAKALRGPSR